jgi:hypothetical protein
MIQHCGLDSCASRKYLELSHYEHRYKIVTRITIHFSQEGFYPTELVHFTNRLTTHNIVPDIDTWTEWRKCIFCPVRTCGSATGNRPPSTFVASTETWSTCFPASTYKQRRWKEFSLEHSCRKRTYRRRESGQGQDGRNIAEFLKKGTVDGASLEINVFLPLHYCIQDASWRQGCFLRRFRSFEYRHYIKKSIFPRSKRFWLRFTKQIIVGLDIFYSKLNISETGFCLRFQVEPTHLDPVDKDSLISRHLHQHKAEYEYIRYAEQKPSARVKTNIKNIINSTYTYEA